MRREHQEKLDEIHKSNKAELKEKLDEKDKKYDKR